MEEIRYPGALENGTVSQKSPITSSSDVLKPFPKDGWDVRRAPEIGLGQGSLGQDEDWPCDVRNSQIPASPSSPAKAEVPDPGGQSEFMIVQTCAEIGIQILQLNDDLLASIEEEEKLLGSLRLKVPIKKKKKVTKCKLFEIGDLVQLFRLFLANWNNLWGTSAVQPMTSEPTPGGLQHPYLEPFLRQFVSSLKETLRANAATFVDRLERLFHVGLDILALQGLQEVPASSIQKCISGILEFDTMVLELGELYPAHLAGGCTIRHRGCFPSWRIEAMLRLIARERAKIFGRVLLDLMDAGVKRLAPNFDRKSEVVFPLPLPAPGHAAAWSRPGAETPFTTAAATMALSMSVNANIGGGGGGGSTSDYCSGGSINGNYRLRSESDGEETIGGGSAFTDCCMKLQTLYSQEELNVSKLAFVIRLSFLECNTVGDSGSTNLSRSLSESRYTRLYWEELDGRTLEHLLNGLTPSRERHSSCAMIGACRMAFLMPGQLVELANVAEELCNLLVKQIPLVRVYHNVKSHFHLLAVTKSWDQSFCKLLAVTANPKCSPTLLSDGSCGTGAGKCVTDCLQVLIGLELLASIRPDFTVESIHSTAFPLLSATLSVTLRWLEANIAQSLAQWHVGKFGYISQGDLKKVVDLLKHVESVNPTQRSTSALWSASPSLNPTLSERESLCRRLAVWDDVRMTVTRFQNCSSNCMKDFCKAGVAKSRTALNTLMPVGKVWQQSCRRKGVPTSCNPYARALIVEVMVPVVEGVARLPVPAQIGIVTMATKVLVETWMTHILNKRIRFSLHGGHLLRLDFHHMIDFLRRQPTLSPETRQSVQSLEVLRQLRGAAALLLHQTEPPPHFGLVRVSRRVSPLGDDQTVVTVDSGDSHPADDLDEDTSSIGSESAIADEEYVTDRASWLALRMRNGQRRTFAPFWCFA